MYKIVKIKCSMCGGEVELTNTPFYKWGAENFKCEKCERLEYAPLTSRIQKIINERGHRHNVVFYKIKAGYSYTYNYMGKKYIVVLDADEV